MRQSLQVLAALLLAAVFAAPASAVSAGGAAEETLTGIIETAQVEMGDGRDHFVYTLRSRDAITPLEFAKGNPRSLSGSRVTITGTRSGHALRLDNAEPGGSIRVRARAKASRLGAWETETDGSSAQAGGTTSTTVAASVDAKSVAVVMFNFTDLRSTPFSTAQVQDALVGSPTSTKRFFEEESKGRLTVTGAVFGWVTINATSTACNWQSWDTLATEAANAAGANLGAYSNVMFVFPKTTACGWSGLGYVPGSTTYLNGTISVQVMTHELGHNFGLSHSNAAACVVGGSRVMIAATANCTSVGYADHFSTMGNNALRHNQGSHLGELGWLAPAEKVIGAPGNSYTIAPYFGADGVKLVRVPRGDGSFFDLDVRTPYGSFDNFAAGSPATAGVTVRIGVGTASPTSSPRATLLLDSTPGTADLKDAPLAVGKTMTDPVSGLSITALSVDGAGIVVRVTEPNAPPPPDPTPAPPLAPATGDTQAPTTPEQISGVPTTTTVALSWSQATDNTGVVGYRVTRNGSLVASPQGSAWKDTGRAPGTTYTYAVAALDGVGNVSSEASLTVTTLTDTARPSTPRNFHKVARRGAYVTFDWSASTDNVGVTRYYVYRAGRSRPVATTRVSRIRIYTVRGASYYVRAVDAAGNRSSRSAMAIGRR